MGYAEAKTPTSRGKKLDHLRIRTNGGNVTVEHHFQEDGMAYHAPKTYEFAKDEGKDLVQHLGKYGGIPVAQESGEAE